MAGSKVDDLIKKRDQLNAKIQAAKTKETQKIRKQQTQAKILLGQALLSRLESNDSKSKELYQWCRDTLTDKDKTRLDEAMELQKKPLPGVTVQPAFSFPETRKNQKAETAN